MFQVFDDDLPAEDMEAWLYGLESIKQDPININNANLEDLENLFFLSRFQILSLLDYRKQNGSFLSIYEIPFVFGFNQHEAAKLEPFIYFGSQQKRTKLSARQQLVQKFIYKPGVDFDIGLPFKLYTRYRCQLGQFSFGTTFENDAGEHFFKGSNSFGADFYSGYLQWENPKSNLLKKVVLGDYSLSFGQGLNLSSTYSMGKNLDSPGDINKRLQGIRRYTSANESQYFRGIAIALGQNAFKVSVFMSQKKLDAAIQLNDTFQYFTAVQQSGLHITNSELQNENALDEKLIGANVGYSKDWYRLGVTYHQLSYSEYLNNSLRLDKVMLPNGNDFSNFSTDAALYFRQVHFFGEWAIGRGQHQAWLLGSTIKMPYAIGLTVLYRYYAPGYYSFYSNAFRETGYTRNESGFYVGLKNTFYKNLTINAYADLYKTPWLPYQSVVPKIGNEYAVLLKYRFDDKMIFTVKYKTEDQMKGFLLEEGLNSYTLSNAIKQNVRFQVRYNLSSSLTFTERIEANRYTENGGVERGVLLYHDTKYVFKNFPISLYGRLTFFDAETFNVRLYQYENDLRYSFYIPFLYGKGSKYYLMVKYGLKEMLDCYFKWEYTSYINQQAASQLKVAMVWDF